MGRSDEMLCNKMFSGCPLWNRERERGTGTHTKHAENKKEMDERDQELEFETERERDRERLSDSKFFASLGIHKTNYIH